MSLKRTLVLLVAILPFLTAKRPFTFEITKVSCIRHSDTVLEFECRLEPFENQSTVSGHMIFSREINEFQMKASGKLPRSSGKTLDLFDFNLDGCKTLESLSRQDNIVKVALASMMKYSNIPNRCPLNANFNYTMNRFLPDADMLPQYTPELVFISNVRGFIGSELIAQLVLEGRVEMKRKSFFSLI